jgi:4-hydroxy-3-methylbut-2-en-1-yl diphosphate reductase
VRKEIVHNKHVVDELRELGAIFVEELAKCPRAPGPFSARTAFPPRCGRKGKERSLAIIDATCPLVTKVHLEAVKFAREGYTIVLIGHKNHDEVIGTLGEAPSKMILVESVEDVDALESTTRPACLPDPNHSESG